jgi:hypothetical protein
MNFIKCFVKFNDVVIINVARQVENEHTSLDKSRTDIRHSIIENEHALFVKNEIKQSEKIDDEMIMHDHENESL